MKSEKQNLNHYHSQKGVSLVELAIVVVIIGLIMGAVMSGVSIKKSSELRSIITQVDQFRVAVEGFEDKYDDLPGDMTDAHDYWDDGTDGVCGTAIQCNGNGDSKINGGGGNDGEPFRFWQHLNLAGFIEGEFTGTATGVLNVPYENCPGTSRIGGGYHAGTHINDTLAVATTNIAVGGVTSATWPANKFLTPSEAFYIDNKTDDGDPDNGRSQSRSHWDDGWQTGCIAGVDPGRTYIKTEKKPLCIMFFDIK